MLHLFSVISMEVEVLRLFGVHMCGGDPFVWCVWCDKYVGGGASFV